MSGLGMASLTGRLVIIKRRLARQCLWHGKHCRPEFHEPLPLPRFCQYPPCGIMLATDAPDGQKYCKPTHKRRAQELRTKPARQVKAAFSLSGSVESHAASCARKIPYDRFGDALQALRWLRESKDIENGAVYQCLACGLWHVTSHAHNEHERSTA